MCENAVSERAFIRDVYKHVRGRRSVWANIPIPATNGLNICAALIATRPAPDTWLIDICGAVSVR